jgi:hypothetical protein
MLVSALAVAACAACAPAALADSIVYEKDGNVWQAAPDGSNQTQITTAGGYSRPTQADDGTIVAVKDKLLHRLDRAGRLLNTAGDPNNGNVTVLTPHLSPDGQRVVYSLFHNGPILTGPYVATSHATRQTGRSEIDSSESGYTNPTWIDNGRVVLFTTSLTVDTQIWTVPGGIQDWFDDTGADLGGGEVDSRMTRFAATADAATKIRLYRLSAPPPAAPEPRCELTGPNGTFFRPTWSPDGGSLAWQEDDGIWVGSFNLDDDTCPGSARLVIPGGQAPDWGPANVSTPGAGSGGDATAPKLKAKAPRRLSRRALLRGFVVRVTCSEACRVAATLHKGRKKVGARSKRMTKAGSAKLKLRPGAKARRKLQRGALKSVSVRLRARDAAGNLSGRVTKKIAVRG